MPACSASAAGARAAGATCSGGAWRAKSFLRPVECRKGPAATDQPHMRAPQGSQRRKFPGRVGVRPQPAFPTARRAIRFYILALIVVALILLLGPLIQQLLQHPDTAGAPAAPAPATIAKP